MVKRSNKNKLYLENDDVTNRGSLSTKRTAAKIQMIEEEMTKISANI